MLRLWIKLNPPYSSQYLTLRQTVLSQIWKILVCETEKKNAPNKSWIHLVCNSQEYSIQQRTVPSIFNYFVTCIHFGRTTTGNVRYQSLFSKYCAGSDYLTAHASRRYFNLGGILVQEKWTKLLKPRRSYHGNFFGIGSSYGLTHSNIL